MQTQSDIQRFLFGNGILYRDLGILLLLTLQFTTLPIPAAQVFPLTSLLAIAATPFILGKIDRSPLLTVMTVLFFYAITHSLLALVLDTLINGKDQLRFFS